MANKKSNSKKSIQTKSKTTKKGITKKGATKKTTKKATSTEVENKKILKAKIVPNKIAIYLFIVGILLCLSLVLGVSYSMFQIDSKQEESNQITVGCFTIDFEDSGISNSYTNLSLTNSYPISTENALLNNPYKFKVTNTCDYIANTTISINVLKTSSVSSLATSQNKIIGDMLYVAFKEDSNAISAPVLLNSLSRGTIRANDTDTQVSYILKTDNLTKNQSKTYSIWMWVPDEINGVEVGNEAQGLTLYSKIDVYSQAVSSTN